MREERAAALLDGGRLDEGIDELRALVAEAPLRERPVGLLMRALHATGDVGRHAGGVRRAPDPACGRARARPVGGAGRAPRPGAPTGPSETPVRERRRRATRTHGLHGRDGHLAALRSMLAERRCVTVVGPGGVGKTAVAAALVGGSAACWWVDLARVDDAAGVRQAVATPSTPAPSPAARWRRCCTAGWRRSRGCWSSTTASTCSAPARTWSPGCSSLGPGLRILATSRERLGVAGRAGLRPATAAAAGEGDRGRPRVDAGGRPVPRARRRSGSGARGGRGHGRGGQRLVRALDGLPLAIELAAGRLGSVTLDDLRDRLDLLRTASRRAPARHRTLAATVDWSFGLLDPEEQRVFLGLSAFAGPFDLAAAEAVLGRGAAHVVADLVDRSLVVGPGVSGRGRYRLLETLRSYARSRLDEEAAAEPQDRPCPVGGGHRRAGGDRARGGGRGALVGRGRGDAAGPDGGLPHCVAAGDVPAAVAMVTALQPWAYYHLRTDVLGWSHDILAAGGDSARRPGVLAAASGHCWMAGRFEEARAFAAEGVEAGGGATSGVVRCLGALGDLHLAVGAPDEASASYDRAAVLAEEAGLWPDAVICACGTLLVRAFTGRPHTEELARIRRLAAAVDNPTTQAFVHYAEGEALSADDPEAALWHLSRSVVIATSVDNRLVRGVAMTAETALRSRSGRLDRATVDHTVSAVRHWFGSGNENLFTTCLRNVVPLLGRLGAHREVAELVAALASGAPDRPSYGPEAERIEACVVAARHAMDEEYEAAWRRGSTRSTTEAAREVVASLTRCAGPSSECAVVALKAARQRAWSRCQASDRRRAEGGARTGRPDPGRGGTMHPFLTYAVARSRQADRRRAVRSELSRRGRRRRRP